LSSDNTHLNFAPRTSDLTVIGPDVLHLLKSRFGYDSFRPGQEDVISSLMTGSNVLAVMPTGSGKSMCFQIPALLREGLTVVVSPLVALMEDQVAALKLAGIEAGTINSSRPREQNVATWRDVAAGVVRLLYIAPERLMTERMLDALRKLPVTMIAVDEAHCISRWGPSFRPDYENLGSLRNHFPKVPVAALTATADEATRNDIHDKLFGGNGDVFVSGFDRPNIRLSVTPRASWKKQLLSFVEARSEQSGIVYCLSRKKTEETAKLLNDNGIRALPYHAGMEAETRRRNQDIFMTEEHVVMVATIAFGMGIDKPDVRYVFHTNLPASMEAYYQEIGRAGRDGMPAEASMLYGLDDLRLRRMFIDQENGSEDHKRREHKRLDTLVAFCETPECRRQSLLSYFGEDPDPCGNCDVCINPPELVEGSDLARLAADAVVATGQVFGAAHIIDVLRGGDTEKVRKFNHQDVAGYGHGKTWSLDDWRSLIRQLVAAGFLTLDVAGHGGLSLSPKGWNLQQGSEDFYYRKDSVGEEARSRRSSGRKSKSTRADIELAEADRSLYEALKRCRMRLAAEQKVPAYVIFPDKSLVDMAARKPGSVSEFAQIHGVGDAKLKKFSSAFILEISDWLETG
jgi:ATP-dependent DNA helicase RecQ